MASLTIGGEVHELRLTATDLGQAELQILKQGGRPILSIFQAKDPAFGLVELEWLVWGAWRKTCSVERVKRLLEQFYAEGGTIFEVHGTLLTALLDSGLLGRRTNGQEDRPTDPPPARASVS